VVKLLSGTKFRGDWSNRCCDKAIFQKGSHCDFELLKFRNSKGQEGQTAYTMPNFIAIIILDCHLGFIKFGNFNGGRGQRGQTASIYQFFCGDQSNRY